MATLEAERLILYYVFEIFQLGDENSLARKTNQTISRKEGDPQSVPINTTVSFDNLDQVFQESLHVDRFDPTTNGPSYIPTHDEDPLKGPEIDQLWSKCLMSLEAVQRVINRSTSIHENRTDVFLEGAVIEIGERYKDIHNRISEKFINHCAEVIHGKFSGNDGWDQLNKRLGLISRGLLGVGGIPECSTPVLEAIMEKFASYHDNKDVNQCVAAELRKMLIMIVNVNLRGRRTLSDSKLKHVKAVGFILQTKWCEDILCQERLPSGFWGNEGNTRDNKGKGSVMQRMFMGDERLKHKKKEGIDGMLIEMRSMLSTLMPPSPIDMIYFEDIENTQNSQQQMLYYQLMGLSDRLNYFQQKFEGRSSLKKEIFGIVTGQVTNFDATEVIRRGQQMPKLLDKINGEIKLALEVTIWIIKMICKKAALREITLKWFSDIITTSESRITLNGEQLERSLFTYTPDRAYDQGHNIQAERHHIIDNGVPTLALSCSALMVLLELVKPIKIERCLQMLDLDLLFRFSTREETKGKKTITKASGPAAELLGERFLVTETKLGKDGVVQSIFEEKKASGVTDSGSLNDVKFGTAVFWLSLRAVFTIMKPLIARFRLIQSGLRKASDSFGFTSPQCAERFAEFVIYISLVSNNTLTENFGHLLEVSQKIIMQMAHTKTQGEYCYGLPSLQSDFWALPACVIKSLVEPLHLYISMNQTESFMRSNILSHNDVKKLIPFLMTLINSCTELTDPAGTLNATFMLIFELLNDENTRKSSQWNYDLKCAFLESQIVQKDLFPSLARCFVAAQKSDYHSRIQARYQYTHVIEQIIEKDQHKGPFELSFVEFASTDPLLFKHFLHHFVTSLTTNIEEGLSYLAEIKVRNDRGETEQDARARQRAQHGRRLQRAQERATRSGEAQESDENEDSSYDEENDEATDVIMDTGEQYRPTVDAIDFVRLADMCRSYNSAAESALKVFRIITRLSGDKISTTATQLTEVVLALNCSLSLLAGPKCSSLKVTNMSSYNFNPEEMLSNVVECYIGLTIDENEEIRSVVVDRVQEEDRFFRTENFEKAYNVIERKSLLRKEDLAKFDILIKQLKNSVALRQKRLDLLNNLIIPEKFMDPIMGDVMRNPVKLPTSGKIVDHSSIERHLMNEETDPFTRQPLNIDDVEEMTDLKKSIEEWLRESGFYDIN